MEPSQKPNDYKVEVDKRLLNALNSHRPNTVDMIEWSPLVKAIADLYHQLRKAKVPWRLTKDLCLIAWRAFFPK